MIFMGLFLTGLVSGLIHWLIRRKNGAQLAETLLLHQLLFLGVAMTISFMGHVLMSEEIAAQIGWVSNGFQKELGYVSLGIGICGFLAVKFRGGLLGADHHHCGGFLFWGGIHPPAGTDCPGQF